MAEKTTVHLVDDIDGSEAAGTVAFALDGTEYFIGGGARALKGEVPRLPQRPRTVGSSTRSTSVFPDTRSGSFLLPVKQQVRHANAMEAGDVMAGVSQSGVRHRDAVRQLRGPGRLAGRDSPGSHPGAAVSRANPTSAGDTATATTLWATRPAGLRHATGG